MSKEEQEGYPLHPDTKAFLEKELEGWSEVFKKHDLYYTGRWVMPDKFVIAVVIAAFAIGFGTSYYYGYSLIVSVLVGIVVLLAVVGSDDVGCAGCLVLPLSLPFWAVFAVFEYLDVKYLLTGKKLNQGIKWTFSFERIEQLESSNFRLYVSVKWGYVTDCIKHINSSNTSGSFRNLPEWKNLLDKVDGIKREPVVAFDELVERVRQFELDRIEKEKEKQRAAAQAFKNRLSNKLQELDKDGNGVVDDIEGDDAFEALLKKHEALLVEKEKEFSQKFVHKFIRMSSYLTQQRDNIQRIFTLISKSQNHKSLDENLELLQSEVHTYQLLLLNSINMVTLLADDKVIDFWKTYEVFDSLNVYDSNYQRQLAEELDNIGDGLNELMGSIDRMNLSMSRQLSSLHRLTESNGASMQKQLNSVNSNLKVNNVLHAVQIYQNRKTNKRLG